MTLLRSACSWLPGPPLRSARTESSVFQPVREMTMSLDSRQSSSAFSGARAFALGSYQMNPKSCFASPMLRATYCATGSCFVRAIHEAADTSTAPLESPWFTISKPGFTVGIVKPLMCWKSVSFTWSSIVGIVFARA